jgi:hypothetical protein
MVAFGVLRAKLLTMLTGQAQVLLIHHRSQADAEAL